MKRSELVRHLTKHGCIQHSEGGEHTLFENPTTNKKSSVPRHAEINTFTAYRICRDLDVPKPPGR